jgi:hypothetical protein
MKNEQSITSNLAANVLRLGNEVRDLSNENKQLKKDNDALAKFCKAFAFIMPEPHKDIQDSLTHTELYRIQHKMAKAQWLEWFNSNPQK